MNTPAAAGNWRSAIITMSAEGMKMVSKAEQCVSRSLLPIREDVPVGSSIDAGILQDVLGGLEYFIPEVLQELNAEWQHESLDGIIPVMATKSGDREAEIFGLCIIISDQTVTPVLLRLQVAAAEDEVSWLECWLGEQGEHGMIRTPYESLDRARKLLYALVGSEDTIDWVYKVTFGQKTPVIPR
jgi:hypothetical protein